jgi:Fe-S cluster biogenesis protein NfuA
VALLLTSLSLPLQELRADILSVISDTFEAGIKAVEVMPDARDAVRYAPEDEEVVELISEIMDSRIRPTVQEDGGDVVFVAFEKGVVKVQLAGSCVGCASSAETLYNGIESMLIYYVPEVKRIEQVFSGLDKVGQTEFEALEAKLGLKKGEDSTAEAR